jgi:hypothetical protein
MTQTITRASFVRVSPNHVACDLESDAVLLNFDSGIYYGLNPIANRIWHIAQQPIAVADILATLLGEYDVDADRCERDLLALLDELSTHKLILVADRL